jgi:hypothetical protein
MPIISGKVQAVSLLRNGDNKLTILDENSETVQYFVPSSVFLPVYEGDVVFATVSSNRVQSGLGFVANDKQSLLKWIARARRCSSQAALDVYRGYSLKATGEEDGDPLAVLYAIEDAAWEAIKAEHYPWMDHCKYKKNRLLQWFGKNVCFRRFYLLGLNNGEIEKILEYWRERPRRIFSMLLQNPMLLVPLDKDKAQELCEFLGITLSEEEERTSDIARCVYSFQENGHVYVPCERVGTPPAGCSLRKYGIVRVDTRYFVETTLEDQRFVAQEIAKRIQSPPRLKPIVLDWELTQEQSSCVENALKSGISLITGSAGTGKTTVVKSLVDNFDALGISNYFVSSFTGKAVARLRQVLSHEERKKKTATMHRFLALRAPCPDFLVLDEASMITTGLLAKFFKVYSGTYPVVFLGDNKQLKPIGWGELFVRLFSVQNSLQKTILKKVHRSRQDILNGVYSVFNPSGDVSRSESFELLSPPQGQEMDAISSLLSRFDSPDSFMILSPFRFPLCELNERVRKHFFPSVEGVSDDWGRFWYSGQRVMLTKNLSTEALMNGDEGKVIDVAEDRIYVDFGDSNEQNSDTRQFFMALLKDEPEYNTANLTTSFAITVHKAQGSEWENVIFYLPPCRPSSFLNLNLIYTGLTRAKSKIIIVASLAPLRTAARQKPLPRYDDLKESIEEYLLR